MKQPLHILKEVGLSEKEAQVYLAILQLGSARISDIAERTQLNRTTIYTFIDKLVALGIISPDDTEKVRTFRALPPTTLLTLQEKRMTELKEQLSALSAITNIFPSKPELHYFEAAALPQLALEELRAEQIIFSLWNPDSVVSSLGGVSHLAPITAARTSKKVQRRLISAAPSLTPYTQIAEEVRTSPQGLIFPMNFSILDHRSVILITSSPNQPVGILIESEEFAITLHSLFEALWAVSNS